MRLTINIMNTESKSIITSKPHLAFTPPYSLPLPLFVSLFLNNFYTLFYELHQWYFVIAALNWIEFGIIEDAEFDKIPYAQCMFKKK